mgnify:CR=1 FL=1
MTAFHFFPEFEDGLRRIPGILRVRVVTTAEGRPIEIHAITDMSKAPKDFVRDIQAVAARVLAQGGRAMSGPEPIESRPGLFVVFLRDPEGNVVELVQYDDVAAYRPDLQAAA